MEKSASVLCKEIRDSAEHAAGQMKKLSKIRIDSDWSFILGSWSDLGDLGSSIALRQWQNTLRELEGHFITIRDQFFAHTAQAEISPNSLGELSDEIDKCTPIIQLSIDQLEKRGNGPFRTTEISQISSKLGRQSIRIHEVLRSITDELQDQTGTGPLSRWETSFTDFDASRLTVVQARLDLIKPSRDTNRYINRQEAE
jgi:hypothetical protein